ncbi:MAG: DUF1697 domain-containing protein [Actinobacteria bacterium]|nr:DUF1697 domain-containing protein [Actinomycetota bacterium]
MADHAAFLRGMNLGGRRITNADLRAQFETMGLDDVGVFRASGNVVFAAPNETEAGLCARIEEALAAGLGYAVPTYLRTAAEVRAIAAEEPFPPAEVAASKGKLQVALLLEAPSAPAKKEVLALAPAEDRLAFGKRELYWLPSGGFLEAALDLKAIDRLLGPATIRTKGTIEQLAARYFPA